MIEKLNSIPDHSIIKGNEVLFHYMDSFQSNYIIQGIDYNIISDGKLFFTSGPKWAVGTTQR